MEYKPYRIISPIVIAVNDSALARIMFPSAIIKTVKRTTIIKWKVGQVVNTPTDQEIALFNSNSFKFAQIIPQAEGGFDLRESGVARSIESSLNERQRLTGSHKVGRKEKNISPEDETNV
jgi:hypothetical protein